MEAQFYSLYLINTMTSTSFTDTTITIAISATVTATTSITATFTSTPVASIIVLLNIHWLLKSYIFLHWQQRGTVTLGPAGPESPLAPSRPLNPYRERETYRWSPQLEDVKLVICWLGRWKLCLTLCPLMPGRPGVPGKPRAPWGKDRRHKLLSQLCFCFLIHINKNPTARAT